MKYYSQKALEEYFGNIGINGHLFIDDLKAGKVPSIEILEPHGDLIDRSKLVLHGRVDDFGDLQEMNDYYDATEVMNAPTVLEASEEKA